MRRDMCVNCSDTVGQLKEKIQELSCAAEGIVELSFQGQCLVICSV